MGSLVLSLVFAVQVPSFPGDLFLCLSCDTSCPSNLLAGTSLKTSKGVAVDVGGLKRVRRELALTWHGEEFLFPSSGPASRKRTPFTRCIKGVIY